MTLRPPGADSRTRAQNALDYEIAQERASALGRLGRSLEATLAALAAHDLAHVPQLASPAGTAGKGSDGRARLVQDASEALWCFIVQREACGLRDSRPVMRDYRVPAEVQNRMGMFAVPRPPPKWAR